MCAVFTVLFYHIGCVIEYALGLHDGARVFPVHAMWYVYVNLNRVIIVHCNNMYQLYIVHCKNNSSSN